MYLCAFVARLSCHTTDQEALRSVSRELMRNHLKHCASSAIQSTDAEAESMYDLVDLMFKYSR